VSIRHGSSRPRRCAGGGIRGVINNVGRRRSLLIRLSSALDVCDTEHIAYWVAPRHYGSQVLRRSVGMSTSIAIWAKRRRGWLTKPVVDVVIISNKTVAIYSSQLVCHCQQVRQSLYLALPTLPLLRPLLLQFKLVILLVILLIRFRRGGIANCRINGTATTVSKQSQRPNIDLSQHILRCCMFNARSLVNKLPDLHYVLYSETDFDCILITESWLTDGITDSMLDPEFRYHVLRCDRL